VSNFGTIIGSSGESISSNGYGTITNGSTVDTTAAIIGTGSADALFFDGESGTEVIVNYGTMAGSGGIVNDGSAGLTVTNSGRITGGISAYGTAAVTNLGSIIAVGGDGINVGAPGSISNAGVVSGETGLFLGSGKGSQVINSGTIAGTDGDAIETNNTGPTTVTNGSTTNTSALITANEQAIFLGVATIANFGSILSSSQTAVHVSPGTTITNGSSADTAAVIKGYSDGVAIASAGGSTLANFATISATNGTGVTVSASGNITNGSAADHKASIIGGAARASPTQSER
jgi:hypothetical protein